MIDETYSAQPAWPRVVQWSTVAASGLLAVGVADNASYARPPVVARLYMVPQAARKPTPSAVDRSDLSGEDISLRGGDLTITSGGDWGAITGELSARQSIEREAVASPGDFARRPTWGMGLRDALMRGAAKAVRDRQASSIRRRLAANPRIDRVDTVDVSQRSDIAQGLVVVTISATVKGTNVPFTASFTPQKGK